MKRASISILLPLILVAACGGGNSTSNETEVPPPSTGIVITPNNGMQVATVAYGSVVSSGDIAGLAGNTGLTAGGSGGLAKQGFESKIGGVLAQAVQSVPLDPLTYPCGTGVGTVTFTFNVVDLVVFASGMLSPGDTILVEYVDCDDGLGEVLHGTIDLRVASFTGDVLSGAYDMTIMMNLVAFQATTDADVIMANGDGTATLNTLTPSYVEASVSGNVMTTDTNSGSESLTLYSSAQTLDARLDPAPYTMVASGTLDSSRLSGSIEYSTPEIFEGFDADYPGTGELLVAGTDSSIRLIAVDNVNVSIEIYSNAAGIGTPDDTISTTWEELANL